MKLYIFSVITTLSMALSAQETCITGQEKESNLTSQLNAAQLTSPVAKIISRQYNLGIKSEAQDCVECAAAATSAGNLSPIEKIPAAPKLLFKQECLVEAGRFKSATPEISCPDGKRMSNRGMCVTENFLKYQNAVISGFSACTLKEEFSGLDPQFLYRLYSLESAFKPQYVSSAGTGLGQLTRIFVEDIHQKHRGRKFLDKVAQSSRPECEAAKIIAKADLEKKPSLKNVCDFTAVGEGLERNILYSLIGLANSWEKDIEPKFRSYLAKYASDPNIDDIKNLILMNAYGAGGRAEARASITRLSHLPPEKFLAALKRPLPAKNGRDLTRYIRNSDTRSKQIADHFTEPLKSQFASQGAKACVNSF